MKVQVTNMEIYKHNTANWQRIVWLLMITSTFFLGGCAQVANQKSSGSSYGQASSASKLNDYLKRPVLTPSEIQKKINIGIVGQPFKYIDGAQSNTAQPKLSADQLYQKLYATGYSQHYKVNIPNTAATRVVKIEQQREGILIFHCDGECANVEISVSGDLYASLGMISQFPAIWFKSPTLYRHTIYVRIANPEDVTKQKFNLQVSLWNAV